MRTIKANLIFAIGICYLAACSSTDKDSPRLIGPAIYTVNDTEMHSRAPVTDTEMNFRAPLAAIDFLGVLGGTGLRLCDLRNFYICEEWTGACLPPWDCNNPNRITQAKIRAREAALNAEAANNGTYRIYRCNKFEFCIGTHPTVEELQDIMRQKIKKVQEQIDEIKANIRKDSKL